MSLTSRACLATYGLAAIFTSLSWRLCHLAIERHDDYAAIAQKTYVRIEDDIPASRGEIFDVHGSPLAHNKPLKTVIVNSKLLVFEKKEGKRVKQYDLRETLAKLIAKPLEMTPEEVVAAIKPGKFYIRLKRKISVQTAEEIEKAIASYEAERAERDKQKVPSGSHLQPLNRAVTFESDFERVYPARELACHVLGFYGHETVIDPITKKEKDVDKGVEGVERSMDTLLAGVDGWRYYEKDGRGDEIVTYRGEERAPRNGHNIRLTLDLGVQQIVEEELDEAYKRLRPKKAVAIVMEPQTGYILALANRPCFDPNKPCGDVKNPTPQQALEFAAARFNHAVSGINEPGSTFKTISASLALERRLKTINDEVWCYNGILTYGRGGKVSDHHPYGMLTVENIIAKSSNIGAIQLARMAGQEPFYDLIRKFGFGSCTGINLPGEADGILRPPSRWRPDSMYHIPFGHEVSATPLQVITATCVFANGGKLMLPQIIREVTDEHGAVVSDYKPQVVRENFLRPDVVRDIAGALEKVTSRMGTAQRARVPGFRTAGKTSTAQLIDPKTGHYSNQDHTVSFVGYLPAEAPRFCALVIIEDSAVVNGREDVGGLVAAPIFSKVAERIARQLGLEADPHLYEEDMQLRKTLAQEGKR